VSAPAIETAGLTKFYGAQRGIEDLDLRVDRGEVFGLLGAVLRAPVSARYARC
jgi:ABC-type multidrug transport system ATPase subunit